MSQETALYELENPVWVALSGNHRQLAQGNERVLRYRPEFGPFLAFRDAQPVEERELTALVTPGELVYVLGPLPKLPLGFLIQSSSLVASLAYERSAPPETPPIAQPGPEIVRLDQHAIPAMLELTALVYPLFFRGRTPEMGRYFGIWRDGRLAAMAGERMSAGNYREVSGVCTHPEFQRRGYARRLISHVTAGIIAAGRTPFLHVAADNEKALALYLEVGFTSKRVLPFRQIKRLPG